MRGAFPDALVTDYEWRIPGLRNDYQDRHVLAAAIQGDAEVLVTANLADFPTSELCKHGIWPLHPDSFLVGILKNDPELTAAAACWFAVRTALYPGARLQPLS